MSSLAVWQGLAGLGKQAAKLVWQFGPPFKGAKPPNWKLGVKERKRDAPLRGCGVWS